jgi:hypothetical protein
MKGLQSLCLRDTQVTDAGLARLEAALPMTEIDPFVPQ